MNIINALTAMDWRARFNIPPSPRLDLSPEVLVTAAVLFVAVASVVVVIVVRARRTEAGKALLSALLSPIDEKKQQDKQADD